MPLDPPGSPPDEEDPDDSFLREAAAVSEPLSADLAAMAPLEGTVLAGRFQVERRAGRGGMGTVYKAADSQTGAAVAIKIVAGQGGSARERFQREAVLLAELAHPRIVRYVAHGTTPAGVPFLAMDWLEGEDLAERLARDPLDVDASLALVRWASEGLAVAHARGVVHRDIKPSNLFLVGGDPQAVKVIDFGVARVESGAVGLTRPGSSLGTVGYMAPEQADEAADVDARADVYGLGCVLFECLTGRPPFLGRPAAVLAKVLSERPPTPSSLRPGIGPEIDALVGRLLAKSRADRPADATELMRAIDALGGSSGHRPSA
jgi:serine/threonine protein kinase